MRRVAGGLGKLQILSHSDRRDSISLGGVSMSGGVGIERSLNNIEFGLFSVSNCLRRLLERDPSRKIDRYMMLPFHDPFLFFPFHN